MKKKILETALEYTGSHIVHHHNSYENQRIVGDATIHGPAAISLVSQEEVKSIDSYKEAMAGCIHSA